MADDDKVPIVGDPLSGLAALMRLDPDVTPPTPWEREQLTLIAGRLLSGELTFPEAFAAVERLQATGAEPAATGPRGWPTPRPAPAIPAPPGPHGWPTPPA